MSDVADAVDCPGRLSIVVQGPLDRSNAAAVMANCIHWRRLFPHAQLICSISADDAGRAADPGLAACCDVVVVAPAAERLPPIKTDSPGPNHLNLMIAAARAGLAVATGEHVLRIRNDLTLGDRSFLACYDEANPLPRGDRAVFAERVMTAEVFTLNPFTLVRMPFHFSDWFHFGRTSDVRAIWQAAQPMTLADATYYASVPHNAGSSAVERRFLSRFAPEQAVSFPVFARAFPELALAHHNDLRSIDASLSVLADNFVLASLRECGARIPKYQQVVDAMRPYTRLECMSQAWLTERLRRRDEPARTVFAPLIRQTARYHAVHRRFYRVVRSRWFRMTRRLRS